MTHLIIISDTHRGVLPDQLEDDIKKCDIIIHAGDFTGVDYYYYLLSFGKEIHGVVGNGDRDDLVRLLPVKKRFNVEDVSFALMHGWGAPFGIRKRIMKEFENDWDILVYGHTHMAYDAYKNGKLILNPGSPTDKRFAPYFSYIKMSIDKNNVDYELVVL